jgi:hypothetical protein
MSNKRRLQILESLDTLRQLNVEARFKRPHYVSMLIECLRFGEYGLAARIVHMLPSESISNALKAFCESR